MAKDKLYFASLKECNENCLFCVKGGENEPTEYLNTSESKRRILQAADDGWKHIFFDGGEPTLRDDLPELIEFAREKGFKEATILTNAVRLAEPNLTERILDIGRKEGFFLSFSISLHSHKEEISEYLVGRENTFKKTLDGIRNVVKGGGNVSIYHLICRYNFKDLPDFVDFLESEFPEVRNICFSFIYPEGAARDNRHIFPRLSEVDPYLQEALRKTERSGMTFTVATCGILPLCYLRGYEIYTINQQKAEKPENVKIIDSAKEENFILATKRFHEKTKVKTERCDLCLLNEMCSGIWNFYAEIHGTDELVPITDKESFDTVEIDLSSIDSAKEELKERRDIFFVEFVNGNKKAIKDLINWMRGLELNYLIRRPLAGFTEKESVSLGIPFDCSRCRDLFKVKNGKVIFCDGSKSGHFDDCRSRDDILKEAVKKNAFLDDCPGRKTL